MDTLIGARVVMFLAGIAGGLFVVPVVAALQEIGHKSIGGAVAVQIFFENLSILAASGLYTLATAMGASPVPTIMVLGAVMSLATFLVSWHLPPDAGAISDAAPPNGP